MPFLVGIDEAGYGPNFGPLVISASLWQIPDGPGGIDLYQRLARVVVSQPQEDGRIAIADSKRLYKPGGGLGQLERGVLAALGALGELPRSAKAYWRALDADRDGRRSAWPWCEDRRVRLPLTVPSDELGPLIDFFRAGLEEAGVRLVALRSLAVFPDELNTLLEQHGSKGGALTEMTLRLLAEVLAGCSEPVLAVCDKHGGRNRYQPLLQRRFPEWLVEVHGEGEAASIYRWGPPELRREVRFQASGEAFLPTALASMACKYLRELSMRAFNEFWRRHVPDLRPTAGYPLDAKRFRQEIAGVQQSLGIDDHLLWRNR